MILSLKDGKGPLPDSNLELLADILLVFIVVGAFSYSTTLDAQVNHLVTDSTSYFSAASGEEGVSFSETQIDRMRWASITSVGTGAFGDERLFCGSIRKDGYVESIRLADDIRLSEFDSVSGACRSRFPSQDINFFTHSQPGSPDLSEADMNLETPVSYTCVIYEEMSISPVSSKIGGINCWEVVGNGDTFEPVQVFAR